MPVSTVSNHWGVAAPRRYFHKPWVSQLMKSVSHKAVCRTAPATPGLLNKNGISKYALRQLLVGMFG